MNTKLQDAQYGTGAAFDIGQVRILSDETMEFLDVAKKILEENV